MQSVKSHAAPSATDPLAIIMKITRNIIFYLLSLIVFTKSYSQDIFLLSSNKEIFQLNSDNTLSLITTINYTSDFIMDIAISSDNIFYGVTADYNIIEIDLETGSFTILTDLNNIGFYTSLVCSNNNELYTLNSTNELYKYDIATGTVNIVGNLGFSTPGDLTFFKGNLIFKDSFTDIIKAYNISNDNVSDIFCLPAGINDFLGISNIFNTCESSTIIGSANNSLYEIDFENDEFIDLNTELDGMVIFGMASDNESLASDCSFEFTSIDCTMSVDELNWVTSRNITYPNPMIDYMYINSSINLLTIEIYNLSGQLIQRIDTTDKIISLNNIVPGIYFTKISSEFGVKTEKIIKQ